MMAMTPLLCIGFFHQVAYAGLYGEFSERLLQVETNETNETDNGTGLIEIKEAMDDKRAQIESIRSRERNPICTAFAMGLLVPEVECTALGKFMEDVKNMNERYYTAAEAREGEARTRGTAATGRERTAAERPAAAGRESTTAERPAGTMRGTTAAERPAGTAGGRTTAERPAGTMRAATTAERPAGTMRGTTAAERPAGTTGGRTTERPAASTSAGAVHTGDMGQFISSTWKSMCTTDLPGRDFAELFTQCDEKSGGALMKTYGDIMNMGARAADRTVEKHGNRTKEEEENVTATTEAPEDGANAAAATESFAFRKHSVSVVVAATCVAAMLFLAKID